MATEVNTASDLEAKLLQMKRMIDEQKSLQSELKQDLLEQQRQNRQVESDPALLVQNAKVYKDV